MIQHSRQTAPTQFVDAAGIRFAYRRFGKPAGVPLVFNPTSLFIAHVTRFLDAVVPFPIQKDTDHD
jgi:hypothetical protein